jgi:MFS family permease
MTILILVRGVREVAPEASTPDSVAVDPATESVDDPLATKGIPPASASLRSLGPSFPRYLAVLLLFTLGNASDAFLVLRAQDLGVPFVALPLLWGVFHLSKMVWNVPGGMLSDRFRPLPMIVGGWLVYAGVYAGFALAGSAWQAWALFGIYGLFYGLTESPEKTLVAELAPSHLRARAFGVFHFAVGLGALPASLLFGILWQWKGAPVAFGAGAFIALVSVGLLPLALGGRGSSPADTRTPAE